MNQETNIKIEDTNKLYLAADGDNVGARLEYYIITNNIKELKKFSESFSCALNCFEKELKEEFEATIFFSGGDNLLACMNASRFSLDLLGKLCSNFSERAGRTMSIGLGSSPQKSYLALKLAKSCGKNTIRNFEDFVNE